MESHTGGVVGEGELGVIFEWQAIQVDSKAPTIESLLFTRSTSQPPAPSTYLLLVVARNHTSNILDSLVETDEERVGKW